MSPSQLAPFINAASNEEAFIEQEFHAGHEAHRRQVSPPPVASATASSIVDFWRNAGAAMWFAKDAGFDRDFRERFLNAHEAAVRGELEDWPVTPHGALALVILLDQFPRNAFRGTPRMYATDAMAREAATAAIDAGHDEAMGELRLFFYLPFGHSEDVVDQERSVALARALGEPNLSHAKGHREIVRRFGRFPHRNPILGRAMTAEEQQFLDDGGYAG
ncbi:DUF924 family protein [Afipia massiliensis]|uniref:DUF924 family protein n=1 Tax=Afipia massiliensis TaxID=211460 RepID=A0A4U6BNC4_9BRAD|nr:DUF924 family protein [Afipia massiliensis]TKT71832.1 DUF924 family protein [Afipia massiliensis]